MARMIMKAKIFLPALMVLCFSVTAKPNDDVLVAVKRSQPANGEKIVLCLDWNQLKKLNPTFSSTNFRVTDQHFDTESSAHLNDSNNDGKPDELLVEVAFKSNEPVYTFKVGTDGRGGKAMTSAKTEINTGISVTYLVHYIEGKNSGNFSRKIVESTMHMYPDPKDLSIISPGKWTYEYGFFLNATFKLYQQTNDDRYFQYIRKWVDGFIGDDGLLKPEEYKVEEYRLDDILPGRLCIWLYQKTREEKYKKVADQLIAHLSKQPKTSEGGYWHKQIYPNQMWLDGIYMGDVFSTQYGAAFNEPHWSDEAILQIKLMYKHAVDPATGLLYHGWDESRNKVWANQTTGTSPEFWTRAIGWYAMALIECLDYIPQNHPERKNIEEIFRKLCVSIKNNQDHASGLWFQVINKGELKDNWIETSGSAMFTYAFAKGFNKGLLDKSFMEASQKAFTAIQSRYVYQDENGDVHLDQAVKVGSLNMKNSKGDYDYYISCERRLDDFKGLAAWLYASMELKK